MQTKAVIFGIKEFRLTKQEKFFFKKNKPWGIILFSRNINSIDQLKLLTTEIKHLFRDKKFPILIDEEGGKISRLGNIIDFSLFSQKNLNHLYKRNKKLFFNIYKTYINTVCGIFKYTGININTTPVLDVMRKKSHSVIGSRSFSSKVENVIKLGNICIELYKKNNIATVIKHIPGHGLSRSDSHHKMPTINADKKILNKIDFKAFRSCNSLFAMTCHAIYSKYDNKWRARK